MRHGAKHLAVTAGADVRFLGPSTLQEDKGLVCLGRHGRLVSLAADPAVPFVLYAGTEDGDILAFDTRESLPVPVSVQGSSSGGSGSDGGKGQRRQVALAFKLGHTRHGGKSGLSNAHGDAHVIAIK